MSKSIYKELLEKIDLSFDAWDRAARFELFKLLEHALEQAQKQEKVLNKIKDIINRSSDSYNISILVSSEKYIEIKNIVKELENEK